MCHFITGTLAAGDDRHAAAAIATRFGRVWEPIENPYVTAQMCRGQQYFHTTPGACDCGTGLGDARCDQSDQALERHVRKHKRRGWSSARVERWLADTERSRRKRVAGRVQSDCWDQIIQSMLTEAKVLRVGLLLHWYGGGVDTERIDIVRQECVTGATISAEFLGQFEEDVLYEFASGGLEVRDATETSPRNS